jgi:hypothetical protein
VPVFCHFLAINLVASRSSVNLGRKARTAQGCEIYGLVRSVAGFASKGQACPREKVQLSRRDRWWI